MACASIATVTCGVREGGPLMIGDLMIERFIARFRDWFIE